MSKGNDRRRATEGVSLPEGATGSSLLFQTLTSAVAAFPDALERAALPSDSRSFKAHYGDHLVRFEAARQASQQRVDIARHLARETQSALRFVQGEHSQPFLEYMAGSADPLPTESTVMSGSPGAQFEVPFEGESFRGRQVLGLIDRLQEAFLLSDGAAQAMRWTVEHAGDGAIDMSGRRFALLGAGAELSPVRALLAAGARVLWVDVAPPPKELLADDSLAGELVVPTLPGDLMGRPRELRATIAAFAADGPVDVGMFAYAAGASQEWRLGAAMNGIVRGLDPDHVASVALWISPTSVATVHPEDLRAAERRLADRPLWQALMAATGMLPSPGYETEGDAHVAKAIVPIQGASYQATQFISKVTAAECYATGGLSLEAGADRPITTSANVLGITKTRSMGQPVFAAAFLGAPKFGVHIFAPEVTRALSFLLLCHDLLNPDAPSAPGVLVGDPRAKANAVLSQQVHGGLYGMPYELYPAIRAAALLGLGMKPSMLPAMFRGG